MMRSLVGAMICTGLAPVAGLAAAVPDVDVPVPDLRPSPSVTLPAWVHDDPLATDVSPRTAVYDLSAHIVVMPDGARLEAHSGLHDRADDTRFVRQRMRGPTPPALYDLTLREAPFHGVAALRLKPVSGDVFGRSGLLAHSFMLHGRPESNGCVVFRDYPAFLKAFRSGQVRRLRVVPSIGEAALHLAARSATGQADAARGVAVASTVSRSSKAPI